MREIERAFAFARKIEANPGVDAGPTMAADALRLAEPVEVGGDWVSDNQAEGEQTGGKGTFPSSERGGRITTYQIRRRMRGIGIAYSGTDLPEEDPELMAILGTRNVVTDLGLEAVEYSGADEGEATVSAIAQTMREEFKALGVVPRSASIELEAARHLVLAVEYGGIGQAPTQQALEAATLDTVVSPVFKGGTFSVGGQALRLASFSLDFGLSVSEPLLDGTAGDGWAGYVLTDRQPTGRFQVHKETLATFDPHAHESAGDQLAMILDCNAAQYNNVRIEADRLEILRVGQVSRGGAKLWDVQYKINRAVAPSVKDPVVIFN